MRAVFSAVLLLVVIQSISSRLEYENIESFIDESNSDEGSIWAVLVAGSNGYFNYRHQADVLHAYQLLVRRGVPRNHIITMMYDDIAYSIENPFYGEVFNIPGGPNVYSGVPIDFHRLEVTPEAFLGVLTANHSMEYHDKPVLHSNKHDNVFIYFADHGGPGMLMFPTGLLYGDELQGALATMRQKEMYKKMVIYVEACESGSLFTNYSADDNVYVVTAANAVESSYACLWNDSLKTYMGDCFSVNWLLDSDSEDLEVETLEEQYNLVRGETSKSHVMHYGQISMSTDKVGEYQGMKTPRALYNDEHTVQRVQSLLSREIPTKQVDAKVLALVRDLISAQPDESENILLKMEDFFQTRTTAKKIFRAIIANINDDAEFLQSTETRSEEAINYPCYRTVLEHFQNQCSGLVDFKSYEVIQHFYKFSNLCRRPDSVESVTEAIKIACAATY